MESHASSTFWSSLNETNVHCYLSMEFLRNWWHLCIVSLFFIHLKLSIHSTFGILGINISRTDNFWNVIWILDLFQSGRLIAIQVPDSSGLVSDHHLNNRLKVFLFWSWPWSESRPRTGPQFIWFMLKNECHQFLSISYWSNSEYWSQKFTHNGNIYSSKLDVYGRTDLSRREAPFTFQTIPYMNGIHIVTVLILNFRNWKMWWN